MRPLLLSLKPVYADLVFSGLKTAELRRWLPRDVEGRDVFVYVSSPKRVLRGGFRVADVWQGTPDDMWDRVKDLAGIDANAYNAYYEGRSTAFVLSIADAWEHKNPLALSELRTRFSRFVVPQSWRYLTPCERRSFGNMRRIPIKEGGKSRVLKRGGCVTDWHTRFAHACRG